MPESTPCPEPACPATVVARVRQHQLWAWVGAVAPPALGIAHHLGGFTRAKAG